MSWLNMACVATSLRVFEDSRFVDCCVFPGYTQTGGPRGSMYMYMCVWRDRLVVVCVCVCVCVCVSLSLSPLPPFPSTYMYVQPTTLDPSMFIVATLVSLFLPPPFPLFPFSLSPSFPPSLPPSLPPFLPSSLSLFPSLSPSLPLPLPVTPLIPVPCLLMCHVLTHYSLTHLPNEVVSSCQMSSTHNPNTTHSMLPWNPY